MTMQTATLSHYTVNITLLPWTCRNISVRLNQNITESMIFQYGRREMLADSFRGYSTLVVG